MSFITESKKAYKQVKENHVAIAMGNMLDDEGSMILNQLEELERGINMLRDYVGKDYEKQLPAWVQSKVTLATDYISTVGNYLSSKNEKATEESIKESFSLEENTFEKIYKMQQDGKSTEDIAKELKLNPALVKKVLGENTIISEGLSDTQISQLKKEYEPLKGKTITTSQYQQLKNILFKLQDGDLEKLQKQNIPFASTGAGSILRVRKSPVKITNVKVPGLEGMAEEKIDLQEKPSRKKHVVFKVGDKLVAKDFRGYNDDEIAKSIDDFLKQNSKSIVVQQSPIQSVTEEPKNPYAIGMAAAMKATGDTPPLKKSTITKAHKIADKVKEEEVELKPVPSLEDSAKKHNVDIEVLKKQLEKGIQVEKEHTKDEKTAEKIALAHLDERPDYYDQLSKVEKQPVKESHFAVGQHVIYKPRPGTFTGDKSITHLNPRKAQIIQITEPQVGAYYKIKISPTLMTYAQPDELKLVENKINEGARALVEAIAALQKKADKSGMPYSILKQVYDRGMAAWKGGHRPGAGQHQWAFARVNSFVTKSSGTWGGADSDLAKKVKGKE